MRLGNPKSRCQQIQCVVRTGPLIHKVCFLVCPHMVERAGELSGVSCMRALISFMRAPPLWPNNLPEASLPYIITSYGFWGGQSFSSWQMLLLAHEALTAWPIWPSFFPGGGMRPEFGEGSAFIQSPFCVALEIKGLLHVFHFPHFQVTRVWKFPIDLFSFIKSPC